MVSFWFPPNSSGLWTWAHSFYGSWKWHVLLSGGQGVTSEPQAVLILTTVM